MFVRSRSNDLPIKAWQKMSAAMPPLGQLVEIRRVGDNKTILRRVGDLPPSFPRSSEWRSA